MTTDRRSALRGGTIGAAAAVVMFGGASVALAATQAGVNEAQTVNPQPSVTVAQAGVEAAAPDREKPALEARPISQPARAIPVKQAGITEAVSPNREVKKDTEKEDDLRHLASAERDAPKPREETPAPVVPVQQAPAPVQSYPVQQVPAPVQSYPVQQAPAPAPAPVQQAPAPAPGLTIDLGGRGAVVPQAPIAPKQLRIG